MSAMHLDEEQLQRLLHRELAAPREDTLREHLVTCTECRARLAYAEREEARVFALLGHLDHRPPRVNAAMIADAANSRSAALRGLTTEPRGRLLWWGRWAAGIVLAMGAAGVAYAAPGSPLPALVQRFIGWMAGARAPDTPAGATAPADIDSRGGLTIAPGDRFTIVFPAIGAGATAAVSLTNDMEVAVRALEGSARFTSDVDRVSIEYEGGPTRFDIRIPLTAPRVDIRIGDRQVFLKDGERVLTGAARDTSGRYFLSLSSRR